MPRSDDAWREQAACRGSEVDFHPTDRVGVDSARTVCAGCSVRRECLAYALKHGETLGVWGGLSEDERKQLL